jgi:hypothetical protein
MLSRSYEKYEMAIWPIEQKTNAGHLITCLTFNHIGQAFNRDCLPSFDAAPNLRDSFRFGLYAILSSISS